jgi:hypothetical protein
MGARSRAPRPRARSPRPRHLAGGLTRPATSLWRRPRGAAILRPLARTARVSRHAAALRRGGSLAPPLLRRPPHSHKCVGAAAPTLARNRAAAPAPRLPPCRGPGRGARLRHRPPVRPPPPHQTAARRSHRPRRAQVVLPIVGAVVVALGVLRLVAILVGGAVEIIALVR